MSGILSPILPEMPPIAILPQLGGETFADDPPPQSAITNRDFGNDRLAHIREMASSPSVLSDILQDPVALSNLTNAVPKKRSRSKPRRGSSSSYREPTSNSPSVMGLVLAEEERQSHHLKAMLRSTGDRLEHETRRADRAEKRAQLEEASNRDLTAKLQVADGTRYKAESESERTKDEVRRLQMQIESMQNQLKRAQETVATVERRKSEAEESASKARETARKFQNSLNEAQARADGREESRRVEIQKYYDRGHKEGWDAGRKDGYEDGKSDGYERGRAAGFEEGKRAGRERGWEEGRAQGRKDERQHAMRAFDKFLQEEIRNRWDDESEVDDRSKQVSRWRRSAYFEDSMKKASSQAQTSRPRPGGSARVQRGDSVIEEYDVI